MKPYETTTLLAPFVTATSTPRQCRSSWTPARAWSPSTRLERPWSSCYCQEPPETQYLEIDGCSGDADGGQRDR